MRISKWVGRVCRVSYVVTGIGIAFLIANSAPAQQISAQSLIYATYEGEDTAGKVFETIKANQKATGERILSYAVVSKDLKGKVHVRDQRKKDAKVGAILGGVIGVLGGPAGAVAGAAAGGSLGYLTGNEVGISRENVETMKTSLTPGSSALAVILEDRWVQDVEKGLREAHARQVVAEKIAAGAVKNPTPVAQTTPAHS